ncbi:hypothetical protein I2F17_08770 [Acinetobacter sp. B10A]|uniref:hypothetical protein n=1 Tax=Acinetobacter baretiae TaxID=2605383 RepID=UPI001B3C9C32|nr:hypothetical protein [Acinetobacter baretiae]MBF7685906.1 hypothetical protein [Acinetobacter baretiae]
MGAFKYVITVESKTPPNLLIGGKIGEAEIIGIARESIPKRVPITWLMEHYPFSKQTILDNIRMFNKGSDRKHLYDPSEVMPVLDNLALLKSKNSRRRKN